MEFVVVLFAFLIVAVIGLVIAQRHWERKRTEDLGGVARRMKFAFSPEADEALLVRLSHFQVFSQGHSRKIRNVMQGTADDVAVAMFDYRYTTGSGKHAHTWRQTVVLFEAEAMALPSFALRPENLFHKIGGVFGYQDIDFESYPTFSGRYLVRGDNEPQIRSLFTRDVLRYYEQRKGVSTEAAGQQLICYRASKRVAPENVRDFLKEGVQVLKLFKK